MNIDKYSSSAIIYSGDKAKPVTKGDIGIWCRWKDVKKELKDMEQTVDHYEQCNAHLQRQADKGANFKMKFKIAQEHIERLKTWQAVKELEVRNKALDEASHLVSNYQSGSKAIIIGAGLMAGAIQRLKEQP